MSVWERVLEDTFDGTECLVFKKDVGYLEAKALLEELIEYHINWRADIDKLNNRL